jgi:RimJ/RimL family protein N-acetyltransferase
MTPSFDYRLLTERLTLRALDEADAPRVFDIQSNLNVTRMLRLASYPPHLPSLRGWLARHRDEWERGTAYRFAVLLDGQLIGCADVDEIAEGCGDLGYWLDEPFWGRGLASEAAAAVLGFALRELGLDRLRSGHASDNEASAKVLKKLGFSYVGDTTKYSQPRGENIVHRGYVLTLRDRSSWQAMPHFC